MTLQIKAKANEADKHSFDISCLLYHKNKLYSASDDGKIKLWSESLQLLENLDAHPCSVYSLTASDDTIYSCSNDGTIKAWTLDLKEKALIHKGDTEIWKICYVNGTLYAGDDQGGVLIFKNDKFFCGINILEPVKDMIVINNIIYAIRDIYLTIVETNIKEDGKGMYSIIKSVHGRGPICLAGGKLFFMDREAKGIIIIESSREEQYKEVATLQNAHELIINSIFAAKKDNFTTIYTGGWDKVVKKWKLNAENKIEADGSCAVDFAVNVITTDQEGNVVYVGGNDGCIARIECS